MEEKKPRVKILVACHKADPNIRQDDIYMPIQVGKALHPEIDLGFHVTEGEEPYYPVNDALNDRLADQYRELAKKENRVLFGGRLAEYRYYNMDAIIKRVFNMKDEIQL